jgi:hypothetical protein
VVVFTLINPWSGRDFEGRTSSTSLSTRSSSPGLCVRRYITYRLSYRVLVAMMAERGVIISHTTIMRWVIRYVPEFEKRWKRFAFLGKWCW